MSTKHAWKMRSIPVLILGGSLFGFFALCVLLYGMLNSDGSTGEVDAYPDRLAKIGYSAAQFFPAEIPKTAQEVVVQYDSTMVGTGLSLQYTVQEAELPSLIRSLTQRAIWVGTPNENVSQESGIVEGACPSLQDSEGKLPKDLKFYLMHSKPSKPQDWNHGEVGFVALSESRKVVLYSYEHW